MGYMQSLWRLLWQPSYWICRMFGPVLALWKRLFPDTPTSYNSIGMDYRPQVKEILHHSQNAVVARVDGDVVLKHSRYAWWDYPGSESMLAVQDAKNSFQVEGEILKVLGEHPRITKFLGNYKPQGFLFKEADQGNLQKYIDEKSPIPLALQARWFLQASEAIEYIHSKGVLHLDLRPENLLLYSQPNRQIDLLLCDFGGSKYGDLYGGNLPDAGFSTPAFGSEISEAIDIFSLGSVFYTISSGHWPYWEEKYEGDYMGYYTAVEDLFSRGEFPPVDNLFSGKIIMKCWTEQYTTASQLSEDCRRLCANGGRAVV